MCILIVSLGSGCSRVHIRIFITGSSYNRVGLLSPMVAPAIRFPPLFPITVVLGKNVGKKMVNSWSI